MTSQNLNSKTKKIYIAGKITGECDTPELMEKCWDKFYYYGINLLHTDNQYCNEGFFVRDMENDVMFAHGLAINSELIKSGKGTYEQYMKNDITVMLTCDEVHFLPDWKNSSGARLEHNLSKWLNMKIIYVQN